MSRKIILCADGTGNAFSTRETNIWRIYQAIDRSEKDQIAIYIPGVGTESLPLIATYDAATGLGVPQNVIKMYAFLCKHWNPGDQIYMFGFSRGAFTVRILLGMILSEGLTPRALFGRPLTKIEMTQNVLSAWVSYRLKTAMHWTPASLFSLVLFAMKFPKHLALRSISYKDLLNETKNQGRSGSDVKIKFVGLFDTVEAFGLPIEELRSIVNILIWPTSFYKRTIPSNVLFMRHALSLDDERKTFHPVRVEKCEIEATAGSCAPGGQNDDAFPDRLREVWFAGVHSDVGGGYLDDELAYFPLIWMLQELSSVDGALEKRQSCSTIVFNEQKLETLKNPPVPPALATLHDSRSSASALYRYGPRIVAHERNKKGEPVTDVVLHHTVVERIIGGDYVPHAILDEATVLTATGRTIPITECVMDMWYSVKDEIFAAEWVKNYQWSQQQMAALVKQRQLSHVLIMFLSTVLLLTPFWTSFIAPISLDRIGATFAGTFVDFFAAFLPSFLYSYSQALHEYPATIALVVISIWLVSTSANQLSDRIAERSASAWKGAPLEIRFNLRRARRSLVRRIARSSKFNTAGSIAKWTFYSAIMVSYICACIGIIVILFSHAFYESRMRFGKICMGSTSLSWAASSQTPVVARELFHTNNPCWASGLAVEKGAAYRVTLEVDEPWLDGLILTDVGGFESRTFWNSLVKLFLRWPFQAWFQPTARIGANGVAEWPLIPNNRSTPIPSRAERCTRLPIKYFDTQEFCARHSQEPCADAKKRIEDIYSKDNALPVTEYFELLHLWKTHKFTGNTQGQSQSCDSPYPRTTLVADFVAPESGELFLFVNDLIPIPFLEGPLYISHYANNLGSAKIILQRAP